jgi:hypothetical protein
VSHDELAAAPLTSADETALRYRYDEMMVQDQSLVPAPDLRDIVARRAIGAAAAATSS